MERRKSPYSIQKRPTSKKNRFIYYAKFRDPETEEYQSAISTGCTRRDDAIRWCEERLRNGISAKARIRLSEYVQGFWDIDRRYALGKIVRGYTLSKGYLEIAESNTRNHLIPAWGSLALGSLTAGKIDCWVIDLRNSSGLAPATINKLLQTLKTILDQAVADGVISDNPARHVRPVKLVYTERGVLTLPELERLFTAQDIWPDLTHYAINLLAASTALRMGEIRGLSPIHMHHDRVEVRRSWEEKHGLKPPKQESFRDIPISSFVYNVVDSVIHDRTPDDILFYGLKSRDKPLSKSVIEKHFRRAMVRIGIDPQMQIQRNISFHSYRHSLNTILRARDVSDSKIRRITGHKSTEIQDRYTHYCASDLKEVLEIQTDMANHDLIPLSSTISKEHPSMFGMCSVPP